MHRAKIVDAIVCSKIPQVGVCGWVPVAPPLAAPLSSQTTPRAQQCEIYLTLKVLMLIQHFSRNLFRRRTQQTPVSSSRYGKPNTLQMQPRQPRNKDKPMTTTESSSAAPWKCLLQLDVQKKPFTAGIAAVIWKPRSGFPAFNFLTWAEIAVFLERCNECGICEMLQHI